MSAQNPSNRASSPRRPPVPSPGERWQGMLYPHGQDRSGVPCFVSRGPLDGPTVLVTAGIHGAEYASIAAAQRLAQIEPGDLHGTLIVVPIVNVSAFSARSIYVTPEDGKNLNRVFPGQPDGTHSEVLASWLTSLMEGVDAYLDLHGGDLIEALTPFAIHAAGSGAVARRAAELADAFGLPYRIEDAGKGMTFSAAHDLGIPAVLAEAGGQGLWPEGSISTLTDGARRMLHELGVLEASSPTETRTTVLSEFSWSRSEASGCWYPWIEPGERVTAGQPLGIVTDVLGEVRQEAKSAVDGIVMFSVTSLAINEGDPLVGVGAAT